MKKYAFILLCLLLAVFARAAVVVGHPGIVPGDTAFSVVGIGGIPLPTGFYSASDEWNGISMTWQWTTDEPLGGLGFCIAGTNGIRSDQDYLLVIQEMSGTWHEQVIADVAIISVTLSASDMVPGWIHFDVDDITLKSNQWYGITLGPATNVGNEVAGQEISWATGSYGGYDGIAASIDLSGGMPRTADYEGNSADVAIYGGVDSSIIDLSIDVAAASVTISAKGLLPDRTYSLESAESLEAASWDSIGFMVSGVNQTNWGFLATNPAMFYRVELAGYKTPETSKHFEKWTDPESRVVSYVLQSHVAPQQQSFYFVNRSMTKDGRYLWFLCVTNNTRTMGVIDFLTDEVRHFPGINTYSTPYVDPDTGDLYWATTDGIYWQTPFANDLPHQICGVPDVFPEVDVRLYQLVCHLTKNASGTKFFLDSRIDNEFLCGDINIETGDYTEWGRPDFMFNHAQFHPNNDSLVFLCKEYWKDAYTGEQYLIPTNENGVFERMWLWEEGEESPELIPPINNGGATHEWWSANGKYLYYCTRPMGGGGSYGIARYDLATGTQSMIITNRATHAYSSFDDNYFVYDQSIDISAYLGCSWKTFFYNAKSHKSVAIVTYNPEYNTPENPSSWLPEPHSNFVANDKYIVGTLNIDGAMNVLLTPVAPLIEMTAVAVSHPNDVPGDAAFSVTGTGGIPLASHYYTANDEWDGLSMTWQWTTDEALDGLGFYIAETNGITSDQNYLLIIQEMTGAWHETVVSNVAMIDFTLQSSDMIPGWVYFDINDVNLVSNQWYGITLGPSTNVADVVSGQEITWATGSWGESDGIAASIDLSGGMPRTAEYISNSADVALYGVGISTNGP